MRNYFSSVDSGIVGWQKCNFANVVNVFTRHLNTGIRDSAHKLNTIM